MLHLTRHRERLVTCAELVRELRGYHAEEREARLLIRPHISNLRRKLASVIGPEPHIINVRGQGYRLVQEAPS